MSNRIIGLRESSRESDRFGGQAGESGSIPIHQWIALGVVNADAGMSEFQEGQGVVHGDLNTPGIDLPLTGQRSRGDPA